MRSRQKAGTAGRLIVSALLSACVLFALSGVAEASWGEIESHKELLGANPVGDFIKQSLGQVLSLMSLVVAVLIAIPMFIAGLALGVSYVFSKASVRQPPPATQAVLHKGVTVKATTAL